MSNSPHVAMGCAKTQGSLSSTFVMRKIGTALEYVWLLLPLAVILQLFAPPGSIKSSSQSDWSCASLLHRNCRLKMEWGNKTAGTDLQSSNGSTLEPQVCLEVLSDFTDQTLEWQLADQQLCGFLVPPDLSQCHGARPIRNNTGFIYISSH